MKPVGQNDVAQINGQHELSVGPEQPTTNLQLKSHMKSEGQKQNISNNPAKAQMAHEIDGQTTRNKFAKKRSCT